MKDIEQKCSFCGGTSQENPCPYCHMNKDLDAKISLRRSVIPKIVGVKSLTQVRRGCRVHGILMHGDDSDKRNLCIKSGDLLRLRRYFVDTNLQDLQVDFKKATAARRSEAIDRLSADKKSEAEESGGSGNVSPRRLSIFLSYRRSEAIGLPGRVFDRLSVDFSGHSIFFDIDSIPLGANFKDYIDSQVRSCDVVIVLMGENWLGAKGDSLRIEDPSDYVRLEVEAALANDLLVIPVFIGSASMPALHLLPPSIRSLAYLNGLTLDPGRDFHSHMSRLTKAIKKQSADCFD